jgi:hypothetical protein
MNMVSCEVQKVEATTELKQLEQDKHDQEAVREQLKAIENMVAGIAEAGKHFSYAQKRAYLWGCSIFVSPPTP